MIPIPSLSMALAGAVAAVGLFAGVQTLRLTLCKADHAEMKSAYLLLGDRVSQQNAAIEAWEKSATEREQRAAAAALNARKARAATEAEITRLRAMAIVTAVHGEAARTCSAAVAEVRKTLTP